jgi:hypothetical protein
VASLELVADRYPTSRPDAENETGFGELPTNIIPLGTPDDTVLAGRASKTKAGIVNWPAAVGAVQKKIVVTALEPLPTPENPSIMV